MAFSTICTLVFLLSVAKNSAFSVHPRNHYSPFSLVVSPLASGILDAPSVETTSSATDFSKLSELLGATPCNLLRVETSPNGVRGVYLNRAVKEEHVILSVPLESCVGDGSPPDWFEQTNEAAWSTRLAAALLDAQSSSDNAGMVLWLRMMPNAKFLRASLPIYWPDDVLSSARCTALELAVDSAYFARADALTDLGQTHTKAQCEHALDIVQTRSCRVECNGVPIRLLAPIFDMINHGSSKSLGKAGSANAQFGLEENELVVRALVDVEANDQVLIDYGDSARPSWRCLASYGFVPECHAEEDEDENVAEVYFHGRRFEVGPSTIPVDLVATASTSNLYDDKEEPVLTPDVALLIAGRVSEVAFQLLLTEDHFEDDEDDEEENRTAEELISARLAASLRWQQHRTLLSCGNGLRDWAAKQATHEKE
jgi:hypothetical protein